MVLVFRFMWLLGWWIVWTVAFEFGWLLFLLRFGILGFWIGGIFEFILWLVMFSFVCIGIGLRLALVVYDFGLNVLDLSC